MRELWQPANAVEPMTIAIIADLENVIQTSDRRSVPNDAPKRRKLHDFNHPWLRKHFQGKTVANLPRTICCPFQQGTRRMQERSR
jgi:hypothetical protein